MQEVIAAFLIILSTSPLFSDQKAETSDGRRVLLRDDGSWEWIVEEDTGSTDQFGTDEIVYGDATPADGSP